MVSAAENETLTRVGPSTPCGELMRRYWHPITGSSHLTRKKVVPIRLLGEDLVLYRDLRGQIGLIDHLCAHRRVDLSPRYPVENGPRCPHHGWAHNSPSPCIAQPGAPPHSRPKDQMKPQSYPVQEP